MASSMVKLVDLKRKKWQSTKTSSKLQCTNVQVLHQCLPIFSRFFSSLRFRKEQESGGKNPSCTETTLAVDTPEDLETTLAVDTPEDLETTLAVEIPEDLVEEILHRVPATYVASWRTVSKGWKSMIESAHLAEKHLRRSQKLYGAEEFKITFEGSKFRGFRIECFSKYDKLIAKNIDSESEALPRVAGSCNGLVCVFNLVDDVYLFNPTNGVIRKLARLQGTTTILSVGFGRDVVTGAYKVAVLYRFGNCDNRVETLVFDLSTSEWRCRYETAGTMPLSFTLFSPERNPVFVKGSLFWLLARDHDHSEILVMDLHTEKFRTVSLPNDVDVSSAPVYMWSLKDRLCISDFRQRWGSDVWVLEQDEVSERRERTSFDLLCIIPPLKLNSAWFSPSLVSPYQ